MGRAADEAACQPVGDLHQQFTCARSHQDGPEDDEDQDIAGHHLDGLPEHAPGLGPEVLHHGPHVLVERGVDALQDPRPRRQIAAHEQIDHPQQAEGRDETAEHPPRQVERDRRCKGKDHEIDGIGGGQQSGIRGENAADPEQHGPECCQSEQPVQPPQGCRLVKREGTDHETEEDRQPEDQPGGLQHIAFNQPPRGAEPVLPHQHALVAPGHLLETRRRGLDDPPHQVRDRPTRRVEQNDTRENEAQAVGQSLLEKRLIRRRLSHPAAPPVVSGGSGARGHGISGSGRPALRCRP